MRFISIYFISKIIGIESSYTIETSMAGFDGKHFSIDDLLQIGKDIGRRFRFLLIADLLFSLLVLDFSLIAWCPVVSEEALNSCLIDTQVSANAALSNQTSFANGKINEKYYCKL